MKSFSKIIFVVLLICLLKNTAIVAMQPEIGTLELPNSTVDVGYFNNYEKDSNTSPGVQICHKSLLEPFRQCFGADEKGGHFYPANTLFVGVLIKQPGQAMLRRIIPAQQLLMFTSNDDNLIRIFPRDNKVTVKLVKIVAGEAIDGYNGKERFYDKLEFKIENFFKNQTELLVDYSQAPDNQIFLLKNGLMLPNGQLGPNAIPSYPALRRKIIDAVYDTESMDKNSIFKTFIGRYSEKNDFRIYPDKDFIGKKGNITRVVLDRQTTSNPRELFLVKK